ncbi:AAA family ATPase [Pantoea agglomerans]|uniref:AAA family ATPase n=1 Tax=Enterobacter agglomerans TaxID=549 RepID=UPI00165448BC|nr:AAA family ATPase [Pantoea agglomerans]
MIVGLFGVSGVGKTTFNTKLSRKYPSITCYSASSLIKRCEGLIEYEKLNCEVVANNQLKLINAMNFISSNEQDVKIVIELHNIIETESGIVFIERDVFSSLNLDFAFFIKKSASEIKKNRELDTKKRRSASLYELARIQNDALSYFFELYSDDKRLVITGVDDDLDLFKFIFDDKNRTSNN